MVPASRDYQLRAASGPVIRFSNGRMAAMMLSEMITPACGRARSTTQVYGDVELGTAAGPRNHQRRPGRRPLTGDNEHGRFLRD